MSRRSVRAIPQPEPGVAEVTVPVIIVTKTSLLPAGSDPNDSAAWDFALDVEYRGEDAWRVVHRVGSELSRAGNWGWMPKPFQRRLYRFDTREAALAAAAKALPAVTVGGLTWEQWQDVRAKRKNP